MVWNKLILNGEVQDIPLGFDAWTIGTGAAETLTVSQGVSLLFGAGNQDQINLTGSIADYSVSMSGNQIRFASLADNSVVSLNVGGACKVQFNEGVADLSLSFGASGPQINLGDAILLDGETLENPVESVYGIQGPVTVTMDDLQDITAVSPFDAGSGDFLFEFDTDVELTTWIDGFGVGDTLSFINTPTASAGDFNVSDPVFGDNASTIGVESVVIQLTGITSDYFNNADTFAGIYGEDALVIA